MSILDKNNGAYEEIAPNFTPGLQKKMDAAAMQKLSSHIVNNFGALKEKKLVTLEKFDQGDRVTYLAGFSKTQVVQMVFAFDVKGEKPLINDFVFTPIAIKKAE